MKELMKSIEYYKLSSIHGIEVYQNKYGDKIMIDLIKNEVTKRSDYERGWLNQKEIEVVNQIMERKYE